MKYGKAPQASGVMSIILLFAMISSAIMLGGCSSKTNSEVGYANDEFGFTLVMPRSFMNDIDIKETGDAVYFVNQEIQATLPEHIMGVVGRIEVYDKGEFTRENLKENEESYSLRYLGENERYYFGWAHATDVQVPIEASEALKERCRAMEKEFNEIIKTFKITDIS
ncbi:MAG: hypothetical protein ACOX6I_00310 [Syntrophomonadaceae bacterium]|jgi:hypothetical protein